MGSLVALHCIAWLLPQMTPQPSQGCACMVEYLRGLLDYRTCDAVVVIIIQGASSRHGYSHGIMPAALPEERPVMVVLVFIWKLHEAVGSDAKVGEG